MKRIRHISIALVAMFLIASIIMIVLDTRNNEYSTNPMLLGSEEDVRERLLELTPLGMSIEDVELFINEQRDWVIWYIDYEEGFRNHNTREIVGVKSIRAYVGETSKWFTISVTFFWGFDQESRLIDVLFGKI